MTQDRLSTIWIRTLAGMFFFSGATALIFQVLWTRLISNLIGSTATSMTVVFLVFIVGLSVGAGVAGRVTATGQRAMLMYGAIEGIVGVLGFGLTMLMLHQQVAILEIIRATIGLDTVPAWIAICAVLVGPAAFSMGLTLPIALNALSGVVNPRRYVTSIYGLNILGGAAGALATGYVLIWKLGITMTAALAGGLNLIICLVALGLWHRRRDVELTPPPVIEAGARLRSSNLWTAGLFIGVAFFGGLSSLGFELLWGRIAKFVLGDRTIATSTLLGLYLIAMALGSFMARSMANRFGWKTPAELFRTSAFVLLLAALAHPLMWWVAQALLTGSGADTLFAGGNTPLRLATMTGFIIVPAAIMGISFPLLMYGAQELDELPSRVVGRLYFINSMGAAIGILGGGYYLPRWVGTGNAFIIFSVLVAGASIACFAFARRDEPKGRLSSRLYGGLFLAVLLVFALAPRELHFYDHESETLIHSAEDEYGIQITTKDQDGMLKVKNNRVFIAYKLGPPVTNFAQEIIAYASCLLAPSCEQVLNIGTGYGITAGAFALMDEPKRIVTVEMLPYVFHNQRMYEPFNHYYLDDPRVEPVLGDGRQYLSGTHRAWDIISVNVLDPYMPGSSDLFTIEFWELAKSKLKPGGVYSQLIFGADVDLIYAGLRTVFKTVLLFEGYANTYNVVAFAEAMAPTDPRLERLTERARAAFGKTTQVHPDAYWPKAIDDAQAKTRQMDRTTGTITRFHSDDWPVLEFQWSQGMTGLSMFDPMQGHDYE